MTRSNDEMWRIMLEGTDPELTRVGPWFRRIPNAPRCKMCNAPYGWPGSLVFGAERRTLEPKGRGRPIEVVVLRPDTPASSEPPSGRASVAA